MPTTVQEYARAVAILLVFTLATGSITFILKKGSLGDALVWLISGCIFGIATTGEVPYWKTVGLTSALLTGYWLIRYFCARYDKPASKQR